MIVELLGHYYRSRLRGSHRLTRLIDRFYPLDDIEVPTAFGPVNVDLTLASGQGLVGFPGSGLGDLIREHARGNCYDIGAHFGIYSVLMAQYGDVIAFEPNPDVYKHLTKTARNRNIKAFNIALSDFNGRADLFVPEEASMSSLINWTRDEDMAGIKKFAGDVTRTDCEVLKLDDFVKDHAIPLPDFMKIDVEGAEIKVLRGGQGTIARSRPKILFEVSEGLWEKQGTSHEEAQAFFESIDYRLFLHGKEVRRLDTEWVDVLAIPAEKV